MRASRTSELLLKTYTFVSSDIQVGCFNHLVCSTHCQGSTVLLQPGGDAPFAPRLVPSCSPNQKESQTCWTTRVLLSLRLSRVGHATVLTDQWWDEFQLCWASAGLLDGLLPCSQPPLCKDVQVLWCVMPNSSTLLVLVPKVLVPGQVFYCKSYHFSRKPTKV